MVVLLVVEVVAALAVVAAVMAAVVAADSTSLLHAPARIDFGSGTRAAKFRLNGPPGL